MKKRIIVDFMTQLAYYTEKKAELFYRRLIYFSDRMK